MTKFIDLFSGAGFFSAGFLTAGFRPILAIDADSLAVESYNNNISPIAVSGSIEKIRRDVRADLVIAGPPCQGFSTLGPRNPDDARNGLCTGVAKWAVSAAAKVVVVENVPPFVGSSYWTKMVRAFRRNGFEIITWCLDAADFRTPQHRRRSFTIASKIGLPTPPPKASYVSARVAFRQVAKSDEMHVWPEPTKCASERFSLIPKRGDWRDVVKANPKICPPSWFKLGCQATDVWGRIDPDRPANTLKTRFQNPSTGRYLHPTQDRVLSLREGARLQGAPDRWQFCGNNQAIAKQIGNGVPIPLGSAVASQVAMLF